MLKQRCTSNSALPVTTVLKPSMQEGQEISSLNQHAEADPALTLSRERERP